MGSTIEPLPLDESFEREYEIEWLRDMPTSSRLRRYGTGGGPILRVTPLGDEPFVVTVPGQTGSLTLSTWPNPRQFAVFNWDEVPVIVDIDDPATLRPLDAVIGHGLRGTYRFPGCGIVVLATCCQLVAYGAGGKAWDRSDLFCCNDRLIDTTNESLIVDVHGHASPTGRYVISAHTGAPAPKA